jgi:hypothetical protein
MRKRLLAVIIMVIIVAVAGIVGFFLAASQNVCFGSCGAGVYVNSAECSSSTGRCDLTLVNRYSVGLNTTGTGTIVFNMIPFNNQTVYLLCTVVNLKPNVNTNNSCMLQGASAPPVGTYFTGSVSIVNGASAAFSGNFTS